MTGRNAITGVYFFTKSTCAVLVLLLAIPKLGLAQQAAFTDTMEAPFWTLTQTFGTVTLSNDVNHSTNGKQALKFTSLPGGERYMHATRTFSSRGKGTFSIWFYDCRTRPRDYVRDLFDQRLCLRLERGDWNSGFRRVLLQGISLQQQYDSDDRPKCKLRKLPERRNYPDTSYSWLAQLQDCGWSAEDYALHRWSRRVCEQGFIHV